MQQAGLEPTLRLFGGTPDAIKLVVIGAYAPAGSDSPLYSPMQVHLKTIKGAGRQGRAVPRKLLFARIVQRHRGRHRPLDAGGGPQDNVC